MRSPPSAPGASSAISKTSGFHWAKSLRARPTEEPGAKDSPEPSGAVLKPARTKPVRESSPAVGSVGSAPVQRACTVAFSLTARAPASSLENAPLSSTRRSPAPSGCVK